MFQQGQPAGMFYSGDVQRDYERMKAAAVKKRRVQSRPARLSLRRGHRMVAPSR